MVLKVTEVEGVRVRAPDPVRDTLLVRDTEPHLELVPDEVLEALALRVALKTGEKLGEREKEKVGMVVKLGVVDKEPEREGVGEVTPDGEGEGFMEGVDWTVRDMLAEAPWVKDR